MLYYLLKFCVCSFHPSEEGVSCSHNQSEAWTRISRILVFIDGMYKYFCTTSEPVINITYDHKVYITVFGESKTKLHKYCK